MAKRVAAKTAPKKRVTKTKAKRAVTKKASIKTPETPPQADVAGENKHRGLIEEPAPRVTES